MPVFLQKESYKEGWTHVSVAPRWSRCATPTGKIEHYQYWLTRVIRVRYQSIYLASSDEYLTYKMSSQASGLLYLPPLLSENISWSPSKVWLVKLAFSKATPFFLLQPTRRTCCSCHLFVPLSPSHLVLSNIFHRIFFNIQIVFFSVHCDSHINAAMNDLYDKIIFSSSSHPF